MTMQSELVFTDPMLNVVIAEVKRFNCPLLCQRSWRVCDGGER